MNKWKPISELKNNRKCVVLIAKTHLTDNSSTYITDPWCGWLQSDGKFARWPHPFPPTHFYELPDLSN